MTVLAVAHPGDALASAVVGGLRAAGVPTVTATPGELCRGRVVFRDDGRGAASWTVELPAARLESGEIGAVLNRAVGVEPSGFRDRQDDEYARAELAALYTAMLEAVPGTVTNRPSGAALAGPPARPADRLVAAARRGFEVRGFELTPDGASQEPVERHLGRAAVVGDVAIGPAADDLGAPLADLARALGCRFLAVDVVQVRGGRAAIGAVEPHPRSVDPAVVELLVADLGDAADSSGRAGRG